MSRMGIEGGKVVVNSYFGAGRHANKEHSDDNEVLQRNKEDLAASIGVKADELTITVIEDLEGNQVNVASVNGNVAINSDQDSPDFGRPVVWDPDTLTPGAEAVADKVDADIAVKDSEANLKQSSANLGHQIVSQGPRGGDPNRISRNDRDLDIESALRERMSSGDPVSAATAKAELEVLGSSVYNQMLIDGQKDKAEKLKEDHIIAARTAAQAKLDRQSAVVAEKQLDVAEESEVIAEESESPVAVADKPAKPGEIDPDKPMAELWEALRPENRDKPRDKVYPEEEKKGKKSKAAKRGAGPNTRKKN